MAIPIAITKKKGGPKTALCRTVRQELCVNSALFDGEGNTIDRQHVSSNPVIHPMGISVLDNGVERIHQDVLKLLVDDGLFPEVSLAVLHPLEVRSGHAACIGEDVRNDEDL